jgi:heme-degrading monooxygenase HmoA
MTFPAPPYTAVIFSSVRTEGGDPEYAAAAARMEELAAEQPGYLGVETARGDDGLGITVSYWRTAEDARSWKRVAEHREAQRRGREEWYARWTVRVATVEREYGSGG